MSARATRLTLPACLAAAILLTTGGCCFSERSFPLDAAEIVRLPAPEGQDRVGGSSRQWLVGAHGQLKHLLPRHKHSAVLTHDLTGPGGRAVDLVAHFAIRTGKLERIWVNFRGLTCSAQVVGTDDGATAPPPWPGFVDVWVPMGPDLHLAGRMGLARGLDGRPIRADCIVLLPGLCGSNNVLRQRDLAGALVASGLHVLALEMRGQGQTAGRYPGVAYTWGLRESYDLLRASRWLQGLPHVRRTGLMGFSWGANHALLAAWNDGRGPDDPNVSDELAKRLGPLPPGRHFRAGVLVFSPIPRMEQLLDHLDEPGPGRPAPWGPASYLLHPVRAGLRRTLRRWSAWKNLPNPLGSLRASLARATGINYDGSVEDAYRFLRLLPYKSLPAGRKLDRIRMPVLIVHAANDPAAPAQDIADLIATTNNPNVAALVLPGGGHIGFAPHAKAWYYSLILNFFDPAAGAAAAR